MASGGILLSDTEGERMSERVQEPNRTDDAGRAVQQRQRRLSSRLAVVVLVILGAGLFVGGYLLCLFVLTECFEEIPAIPGWIPIGILAFGIVGVWLTKFCPLSRRVRVISRVVVLCVSGGALLAVLCVWGLPV